MSLQAVAGDDQDKIYLNVGGKRHESYLSTLRNIPDTRLAWMAETMMNKQGERKELFFDRHPDIFSIILNYYRTGKLHAPRDVCGPLFEEELQFWGIEEKEMEACCWPNYTQHREAEKNLKDFVGPEFEDEEEDEADDACERENSYTDDAPSVWQRYQPPIWAILDDAFSSVKAKIFALVSLLMILISVMLMCTASLPPIRTSSSRTKVFTQIEYFFCAWFTLEFLVRLIFCPNKLSFFKQVMTWIDFISLVPYYRKIFWLENDTDFLRAIRLIRLFRAFRFFKFTSGLQIIVQSLKASVRELLLLVIILLIPVVLFSSIVYELEKEKQPKKFDSIPQTFWWAVITMTTVGYGDMAPETFTGQLFGSVCAICGVLIIGLPVSVIGNNFSTYYEHAQARLSLPKKKRRLIIGDANRLAFMGQSNSSADRDQAESESETDNIAPDGLPRNSRRYHRRSRNTLFARGDVYIGQVKSPKLPHLKMHVEAGVTETEKQGSLNNMERGEQKSDGNLRNSTHESGAGEQVDKKIPYKHRKIKTHSNSRSLVELKSFDKPSGRTASPISVSTRSFRSRISPTPQECDQSNAMPSRRCNTSLTLPPLTVQTRPSFKDDPNDNDDGSQENVRENKNGDVPSYSYEHRTRNGHQNGNVPRGS